MIIRLKFLLKTILFYLILFVCAKLIFITYQFQQSAEVSPILWFQSIYHGLVMDIAMTSYVIMLLSTLTGLLFFLKGSILKKVLTISNTILLIPFILVIVIDLELYRNWGYHFDTTPFQYLKTPEEAAASSPWYIFVLVTVLIVAISYFALRIFKQKVAQPLLKAQPIKAYYAPIFLVIAGSMIIPARGGFDVQPMNTSFVYYSSNIYANHMAVNPVWNFLYALDHMDNFDKDYTVMPDDEAQAQFAEMMKDDNIPFQVINKERPNIILIILESFSADLLQLPEVAPNLCRLNDEGLSFKNYYAVAARSDKGLSAIFSAYPAHPGDAVIKNSNKIENMPNLGKTLKSLGYYNAFYYGGDINFANMNSYLNVTRFDKITTKDDFPSKYYGAKWGVHDQYTLDRFFTDIETEKQPFFNAIFTLSSHEPFDVPEHTIKGESVKQKFLNTAQYTDKYLGQFIQRLKESPYWDNTLVMITADHGSAFIHNYQITDQERYHIPMIWTGGCVTSDTTILKYGSQTDVASTLLHQLKVPADKFIFSKDLLSPDVKGFSYFSYKGGSGYINKGVFQVYDVNADMFISNKGNLKTTPGRTYLQVSYDYFLKQ